MCAAPKSTSKGAGDGETRAVGANWEGASTLAEATFYGRHSLRSGQSRRSAQRPSGAGAGAEAFGGGARAEGRQEGGSQRGR
jgi:hypothetical protein